MAEQKPSSAPSAAASRNGAGFELRLERGGAYVRLAEQPIVPGLRLESLTLQVPDVKFPFDVGLGSGQFRHRLSDLVEMSILAEASVAEAALAQAGLAAFGVEDVRLALREGFLEIAGRLSGGPAFTLKGALLPAGDQGVQLVFHSPRILGTSPIPAAALPHVARAVVAAIGPERLPEEPLAPLLRRLLAGRGWKLPRTSGARLARAEITGGAAWIVWDRDAAGPVTTSGDPDLLAAVEGARTFRDAEACVARNDADAAREAYLDAGPAATAHPFAAERLLSLLALEDRFHEEALDLSAEWLARRPGFPAALATEAQVRLARGEEGRAARALAELAEGAASRGEVFCALAAAEAAFSLPNAAREHALRAIELALGVRRDHVPALRALRALARATGDKEGLLRASRRLVAYDPDPASKARSHAELGELLLETDPPGARLHLDQALRLAPDDADALSALGKACAAAGEPLRAVRALDKLRELHLARGDLAAAAATAAEAGGLWEEKLSHPENALLRYREACELAPSAEAHARAARAAEAAGHWAEATDHHGAVLASIDLAAPGAAALAARTRVALAEVAEKRLGDRTAAAVHLEAAAALAPGDAPLLRRLLALERGLGRTAEAALAVERLAAVETEPRARAALLAEAGEAALALGRAGDARSRFAAAIAADGTCRPALLGLSRLARERGDAVAERDALARLLPLAAGAAETADVQDRLADASERAGDLAGALAAAAAARDAAPTAARLDVAIRLVRRAGTPAQLAELLADRARAAQAAGDAALATDALVERARLLAPQSPAAALAALADARATSPGDGVVLRAQADLAERTGDHRLALGCLRGLLASAPPDSAALDLRAARAALAAGEMPAAKEHGERALDRGAPGAAEVLDEILDRTGDDGARGEMLSRLGRHLEAARLFERAGDPARARAALERAAEDPALALQALPRLAELRLDGNDRAGAGAALLALARLTPGREGARLALRAHALGRDAAALDLAIERDPGFAPARAKRAAATAGQDPRAALADAEAALAGEGVDVAERPSLLALAAGAAAAAGDGEAARRHLAAYCSLVPDDDAALARLAALHRAAGADDDLARVLARRLEIATGPAAAQVRVDLSDLVAAGDPARAARLALEALELDPGSLPALRALAGAPRAAHVPPEARAAILARLASQPAATPAEASAALAMRAQLLSDAGDGAGALAAVREAARLAELDDDALDLRAALAGRAGQAAEAAAALLSRALRAASASDASAAERLCEAGLAALAAGLDGAEDALRRGVALRPGPETARAALEALAGLARARGDDAAERDALASLVPLLPTGARPAALLRHSALALAGGDPTLARSSAEEARALAPRDPAAVDACRVAALAGGDLARVAEALADLAALEPASAGPRLLERARLLASLGRALDADGAYAGALAALPPDRALADEHSRHRRDALAGRGAAEPLEAYAGRRGDDPREAAHALRAAAATAWAGDDPEAALRCARRAYARTQEDLSFAAPLLARILYLRGGGAEAFVLHRRLHDAGYPGVADDDAVALSRQAAELFEDVGERELAVAAYDRLLALRPQEIDAALRRFELNPDRIRAVRALAEAADACRSRRRRAAALARAAASAAHHGLGRDLGERLFRRALDDAAIDPRLAADVARRRADATRAAEGASSPAFLGALHEAAAAAQSAGDRAAARDLLEEAVDLQRERGLFADAARDLLQADALAVADGDFAESGGRARAAATLLREAGDVAAAAEVLRSAYAANPASEETFRQLEDAARALGTTGAPLLVEVLADRAARAAPGPGRATALVALADAHAAASAPRQAEAALRAALADAPGHAAAEDRLLALLAEEGREADRARVLLERSARLEEPKAVAALRREAATLLATSSDAADRGLAADVWAAVAGADRADLGAARAAAALLVAAGRTQDAIPFLAAVVRADPDDEIAARDLAEAYADRYRERAELQVGRAEGATGEARASRLREAARAYYSAGDEARARDLLREAFEAWPADSAAFAEALRAAAAELDRTDDVLRARAEAVPAEAAACHRARGDALTAFGETERAIAAYEAALAAAPEDLEALASLATCIAAGRGEAAARDADLRVVASWAAAPALVPAAAEAPSRYRIGLALHREGQVDDALPHLERAVALASGDARAPEAWAAIARTHASRGDAAAALAAARARVMRADALGPDAERRAAVAAEAAIADEVGLPAPPLPPALDAFAPAAPAPGGAGAEGRTERSTSEIRLADVMMEEAPADEAAPEAGRTDRSTSEIRLADVMLDAAAAEPLPVADETGAPSEPPGIAEPTAPAEGLPPLDLGSITMAEAPAPPDVSAAPEEPPAPDGAAAAAEPAAVAAARDAARRADAAEDPSTRAAAWIASAQLLLRAGAVPDEVRAALDLAADADPDAPEPWRARARIETSLGDPVAAARAHLSVSIRAEGAEASDAALEAARLFQEAGRHDDAIRAYRAAAHACPEAVPDAWLSAEEALARGDAAGAADLLAAVQAATLAEPVRAAHARQLARALEAAGRAAEAERAWTDVLAAAPDDAEAAARAAALAGARDETQAAAGAAWLEELSSAAAPAASAEVPQAGEPEATLPFAAPAPHEPSGDAVAAVLREQADAAAGPERADLLERLAAHLDRAGDREGAADALVGAVEADPQRDATWSWLLVLAPDDDARLARADAARHAAETSVSFSADEAAGAAPELEHGEALLSELLAAPPPGPQAPGFEAETAVSFQAAHGDEVPPSAAPPPAEPDLPIAFRDQPEAAESPTSPPGGAVTAVSFEAADAGVPAPPPLAAPSPDAETTVAFGAADAGAAPGAPEALAPETPAQVPDEEAPISFDEESVDPHVEVETRLPPLESPAADAYARDGRLRMERGDFAGAYERLSIALAREPSDLTVARDLSRVTERLGLFDEYVQLGELCADAISSYDPLAAAARFRHFAEVLRDRLGQVDRAGVMLEKALALVPDDPDTRRELVQLWSSTAETAPRALDTWLDLARRDPTDAAALAGVAEVCERIAVTSPPERLLPLSERGRIAASLAAFVAPATHAPPAPARTAPQVPIELRARVAAPGATGPLARLLRLLAPWLEPLFPSDLGRRGASPSDAIGPSRGPALAEALERAARALWARPHAAFLSSRLGLEIALENTQPPAVVATAGVAELPPAALAFLSARALDLLDHGWTLVGKFAPKDVGILLELACRFAGGAPPGLGLPAERAGAFLEVLAAKVPPAAAAAAAELAAPASDELAEVDPRAFAAGLRRTANRVALLYAGDPGAALHALAVLDRRLEAGPVDPVQALALPDLRDLALFALSEAFLELRAGALG